MSNPLVSIVICCHNRRQYLPCTMESVFAQHYEPVEIVVLDDGSTDGTDELMKGYGDRIRYFWQQQAGIAAARTAACKFARGDCIAFQDDDDLMPPERITKSYRALCDFPEAVFVTGDFVLIDTEGHVGGRWLPGPIDTIEPPQLVEDSYEAVIWPKFPSLPHTTLFRKADGERIGWFDHEFKYASEDKDFYARLARLGPVVYLRDVLSYYRRGHRALSENQICAMCSRIQLLEKHLGMVGGTNASLRKRLQFRMRQALQRIALLEHSKGTLNGSEAEDYKKRGEAMLSPGQMTAYLGYKHLKLPLRGLVRQYRRQSP